MTLSICRISLAAALCLLATGCATSLEKPETMAVPAQASCFSLAEPLEATEIRGLFKYEWRTRIERGAYVAAHENERGTYFRGPPGAIFIYQPTMLHKPSNPTTHMTVNGGVFVPRQGGQPELYTYITDQSVQKVTPPEGANCATAIVSRDPVSKGVSVKDYAILGGAAGARGGLTAHQAVPNSSMGQAVGVGAIGGSAAMAIVGALINMEVGKIGPHGPSADAKFNGQLATAARTAAPLP